MTDRLGMVFLVRTQSAFHNYFPSFTAGLAAYLAVLEGRWLKTVKNLFIGLCDCKKQTPTAIL